MCTLCLLATQFVYTFCLVLVIFFVYSTETITGINTASNEQTAQTTVTTATFEVRKATDEFDGGGVN